MSDLATSQTAQALLYQARRLETEVVQNMSDEEQAKRAIEIINQLAARISDQDLDGSNKLLRQAKMQIELLFGSHEH